MAVDLRFQGASFTGTGDHVDLRLGAGADAGPGDATGELAIAFGPPLVDLHGITGEIAKGTIAASFDEAPVVALVGDFDLAVYRGPRLSVGAPFQNARPSPAAVSSPWAPGQPLPVVVGIDWNAATPVHAQIAPGWQAAARTRTQAAARYQEARPAPGDPVDAPHQEARVTRLETVARYQEGVAVSYRTGGRWQETIRTRRAQTTRYQEARPVSRSFRSMAHDARGLVRSWSLRYQEAKHPPPGRSVIGPPDTPPPDLCYTPPPGSAVPLVLKELWDGGTELTFVCDNHSVLPPATVVVPIREVYMIANNVSLTLIDGEIALPARTFSLSLDYKSWTWGFTATVPFSARPLLLRAAGDPPKLIRATINGQDFVVAVSSVASDREFGSSDVQIQGIGQISVLDDPYAPTLTFDNHAAARTAQQIANDVLTDNGVSIGWAVEWGLTDWLVPAGSWSFQGTYAAALQAVAAAAGGYVQPHATEKTVRILPLFPAAPWEWETLTPDFELPSAAVKHEGLAWADLPGYNHVYVSGTNAGGVLGAVKRAGTAGDVEAPMVTDQLITHQDAARQRGLSILAQTGLQVNETLTLPVLPETGVILPGATVRYVDENEVIRFGVVRSVAVAVSYPSVLQTIGVETYDQ